MDIQLKRGYIEICVLVATLKEDTYGYQLIKDVSQHIEISESTLYPILRRLEQGGLLVVKSVEHNGRLRKYYKATMLGKERIKDFLSEMEDIKKLYDYIKKEYEND